MATLIKSGDRREIYTAGEQIVLKWQKVYTVISCTYSPKADKTYIKYK
jgi:hypothetical protein